MGSILFMIFSFPFPGFSQDPPSLPLGMEEDGPEKPEGLTLPEGLSEDSGPALPEGMGEGEGPSFPKGLEEDYGPSLPMGMGQEEKDKKETQGKTDASSAFWYTLTGFCDIRAGMRTGEDPWSRDVSLGEIRLQTSLEARYKGVTLRFRPDFLFDPVPEKYAPDLENGYGMVDLREASLAFTPVSFLDMKIGRQILTWGTGDMLFINDMFPKDWQSFFTGRDDEYLKAPSDAAKASFFFPFLNLDLVYTPCLDHDRFPGGQRLSYYNSFLGRRAGEDAVIRTDTPNQWFEDDEIAFRVYRNLAGVELAAYGYTGYWKSPSGMDPESMNALFTELDVYGMSIRSQVFAGIASLELGYYESKEDENGDNPMKDNSQIRILLGYDRDLPRLMKDFKVGIQYYTEIMQDYDAYEKTLSKGTNPKDEVRHVLTLRITKQLMNQNLTLSLFGYYSPSDQDTYLRPNIQYKFDDHWTGILGGNIFAGKEDHTFFGQFEKNTNVYAGIRYGF